MSKLDELYPKKKRPSQKKRGLGVVVLGDWETGKTYLIRSAKEPVMILDMDDGCEAFWEQYDPVTTKTHPGLFADKDIRIIEIPIAEELQNPDLDDIDMDDIDFQTSLVNSLANYEREFAKIELIAQAGELEGGTVALDTATWLWLSSMDYMKYKVLKLDPTAKSYVKQQWDWDVANKKYINLYKRLMALRKYGVNVIITVHVKDKWEEKEVKGKIKGVKTSEMIGHWQKKSPQMSPLILQIDKKTVVVDGKVVEKRIARCIRMRGVPNAKKLFGKIEDITWDKLEHEIHNVLVKHEEIVAKQKSDGHTTSTSSPTPKSDSVTATQEGGTRRRKRRT